MRTLSFFLAMLITLSLALSAHAQSYYAGITGGLNFADLNLKAASGTDQLTSSQTEFAIGAILGRNLNSSFSIELDALYLHKGGTQMATTNSPNVEVSMSVLEIPIFIKAAFGTTVRPYVKAGPSIGFILSSQAESEYGGAVAGQPLQTYQGDLNDVLKKVDFGICLGAGISFSVGNGYLFIEGRYSHGLVDLYQGGQIEWNSGDDNFVVEANEAAEMYNKGFQVMTGFTFPLSGAN